MPNTELLRRTLAHIEAHPNEWDQTLYAVRRECGTSYCFAGWAVILGDPRAEPSFDVSYETTHKVDVDGEILDIADYAEDLLRLEHDDARILFDSGNTLEDLRYIVANLVGGFDARA